MTEYRRYRNTDPPLLLNLFRQAGLGRGGAWPDSVGLFELSTLTPPYFDPQGLIVAFEGGQPVGYVHAGFGFSSDLSSIDRTQGVIALVVVHPEYRRRGIGRELVQGAERFLRDAGATTIQAGESKYRDPFYFGLYGGARPSGFLRSEINADPFFQKLGYQPTETVSVLQRNLRTSRDPTTLRLMSLRRATELVIADRPPQPSWWWWTHFANIESMRFQLVLKKTGESVAAVTVIGLDCYIGAWGESAIGMVDMDVSEQHRGQGYGQTLLVETVRRLRTEMITRVEIHVPDSNPQALKAVQGAGFEKVDTGVIYKRAEG